MLPHVPAQAVLMIPPQPPAFCGVSRQRLHQPAGQTLLNKDSGLLQWVLGKLAELVGVDDVPVEDDSIGLDLTSEVQNHAKCQGVMEGDLQIVDDEPRFHSHRMISSSAFMISAAMDMMTVSSSGVSVYLNARRQPMAAPSSTARAMMV